MMKPGEQVGAKVTSAQERVRCSIWSRSGTLAEVRNASCLWADLQDRVYVRVALEVLYPARGRIMAWPR